MAAKQYATQQPLDHWRNQIGNKMVIFKNSLSVVSVQQGDIGDSWTHLLQWTHQIYSHR